MSDSERRDSERRDINDILLSWIMTCGIKQESKLKTVYYIIEYPDLNYSFEVLLDQLLEEGYDETYIKSAALATKMANLLWSDKTDHSPVELRKKREKWMAQWNWIPGTPLMPTVVGKRFMGKMGSLKDKKKQAPVKEIVAEKKKEIEFVDSWDIDPNEAIDLSKIPAKVFDMPKDMYKPDNSDVEIPADDLDFFREVAEIDEEIRKGIK